MMEEKPPVTLGFFALFALFALSFGVFYWNLSNLQTLYFDEAHYIDAIRRWVHALGDSNREHPPLGRMLMGLSMQFLGDTPLGWRFPSLVAGSWSVVSLGLIAVRLTHLRRAFWITGILALSSGGVFVFARIAMLDGIAIAFMLFSTYFLIRYLQGEVDTKITRHAGFYLGLSLATKWLALPYWGIGGVFMFWIAVRERSRMRLWTFVSHWIVYPILMYAVVYGFWLMKTKGFSLHALWESLTKLQLEMFEAMNTASGEHPYRSLWWEWPKMVRPTWFLFEPLAEDATRVRGVLFWVNPVILVLGTFSLLSFLLSGLFKKDDARIFVVVAYFALWLSWFFSWRQMQFFYYYFPAVTMLMIALGVLVSEIRIRWIGWSLLATNVILFFYFYPILSGSAIEKTSFTKWMWFQSWI